MRHSAGVARRDQNDQTTVERVDPLLGTVLDGKYRLEFRLAAGGFGAIYRSRHVETNVELAVKVVHARLASDEGVVARFVREGQALTTLCSPHTITAYELGETSAGVLYIAMELLHGVSLYERCRVDGPLPWRRAVPIALGVCASLAEAHGLGIVHRDLKPTNIHLERRGPEEDFVKVLDFGIAKILQNSQLANEDLTNAGLMIGTIDYMSPEQMVGGEISGASDLYTLGIVLYEMIAGRRPFAEAPSPASALAAMLKAPPPLSTVTIVPAELDRIVMKCLERDPEVRYQTAEELAADLRALIEPAAERRPAFDRDDDATMIAPTRKAATLMMGAEPAPTPTRPVPTVQRRSASRPIPSTPTRPVPVVPPPQARSPSQPPPMPGRRSPSAPPAMTTPLPRSGSVSTVPMPGLAMSPGAIAEAAGAPIPPGSAGAARAISTRTPMPGAMSAMAAMAAMPPPASSPEQPITTLRGVPVPSNDSSRPNLDPARVMVDPSRPPGDSAPVELPGGQRQFDPARDAMVGRVVWICVLVIIAVIGIVIAARF
jgi:serine/threonine-protein kinase